MKYWKRQIRSEHGTSGVAGPDLGNWNSIWKISEKTDNGNTLVGDSFVTESNNSLIWNEATSLKIITAGNRSACRCCY